MYLEGLYVLPIFETLNFIIASALLGSILIPFIDTICPKNLTSGWKNLDFSKLIVTLYCLKRWNTYRKCLQWSSSFPTLWLCRSHKWSRSRSSLVRGSPYTSGTPTRSHLVRTASSWKNSSARWIGRNRRPGSFLPVALASIRIVGRSYLYIWPVWILS